jgi:hypothetical protein
LADLNQHCQPFDSATILVRTEQEFNHTDKKRKKNQGLELKDPFIETDI